MEIKTYDILNTKSLRRSIFLVAVIVVMLFFYATANSLWTFFTDPRQFYWLLPGTVIEFFLICLFFPTFFLLRYAFARKFIVSPTDLAFVQAGRERHIPWHELELSTYSPGTSAFVTRLKHGNVMVTGVGSIGFDEYQYLLDDLVANADKDHVDVSSLALASLCSRARRHLRKTGELSANADAYLGKGYRGFLTNSISAGYMFKKAVAMESKEAAENLVLLNTGYRRWLLVVRIFEHQISETDDPLIRFCYAYGLFSIGKKDLAKNELIEMRDRGETLGNRVNQLLGMLDGHVNR